MLVGAVVSSMGSHGTWWWIWPWFFHFFLCEPLSPIEQITKITLQQTGSGVGRWDTDKMGILSLCNQITQASSHHLFGLYSTEAVTLPKGWPVKRVKDKRWSDLFKCTYPGACWILSRYPFSFIQGRPLVIGCYQAPYVVCYGRLPYPWKLENWHLSGGYICVCNCITCSS